jgi:hypothetical protein
MAGKEFLGDGGGVQAAAGGVEISMRALPARHGRPNGPQDAQSSWEA